MAVTLNTGDLQQPIGELTASLFPADDFDDLLLNWLAQAVDKVEASTIAPSNQNDAAAAWVYYRGYTYAATLLAASPTSVTVGPRTESVGANQWKYLSDLAALKLSEYQSYFTTVVAAPVFFSTVSARRWCNGA